MSMVFLTDPALTQSLKPQAGFAFIDKKMEWA